jgi:alkylation response protein AidB-like acyl-CoA dehydrogenase
MWTEADVDLRESAEQRDVRERYVAWLTSFLPDDYYDRYAEHRWDMGLRRAHQQAAFEGGWLQPTWPAEHGGQSLGPVEAMTVRLESAVRAAPKLPNIQGVNVVAPGLREYGTPEQQERLLVPVLRGTDWWALGMSEPGAGSDFASLRTRAVRDGDDYVVNGQKIWTTQAHESRYATLYVRTDVTVPKHRGISCLLLDLTSPGVTIRPIRMATETDETFCEVFLEDVVIPASALLGAENAGWQVAMASLEHERDMIWIMNWVEIWRGLRAVKDVPEHDQDVLVELGRRLGDAEALRITGYRSLTASLRGRRAPEAAILKLLGSEALQRTWELAATASGSAAPVVPALAFERHDALAASLYGGTSEVQRNIIGERVLGLPKG